ncbi:MAG: Ubiquinone/menaquinone biosynthesis C-methyltransferase UbiE [Steroidobacteraceae bacterium]|nr:Ubiquinone/menaquinone biosynthesis C-methyltransferase UbiE [Steroidobacteraceae bacterium]
MVHSDPHTRAAPAEVYERLFVPALFRQWGPVVLDAAGVRAGHHVLDVACGTGALTGAAAQRVQPGGTATGLDANDDMLTVARRNGPAIEWRQGRAEQLPFTDEHFDAVVSQFGLMFFEDRTMALREMRRVLRPGGRIAIAVWDALDHAPGYAVLAELLHRLFGPEVAEAFRAPFTLGDPERLSALCSAEGFEVVHVTRHDRPVHFASIDALVAAEHACVWTLGGLLDDTQFERLRAAAQETLRPWLTGHGPGVEFVVPALIATAARAGSARR